MPKHNKPRKPVTRLPYYEMYDCRIDRKTAEYMVLSVEAAAKMAFKGKKVAASTFRSL